MPAAPQQIPSTRRASRYARWLALGVAILIASLNWPGQVILPALSPMVALAALIALRGVGLILLLALPALALMLLVRRGFCRYACPVGLLEEKLGRLRPGAAGWFLRCPRIGRWTLAITLGGAIIGYPIFLWLDPLALFNGFFSAARVAPGQAALLSGIGLPLVLLISVIIPHAWCRRICPLGAMQDLVYGLVPRGRSTGAQQAVSGGGTSRRMILSACAGIGGALVIKTVRGNSPPPLRPPGAADDLTFIGLCVRCGNCIRSCPANIIHPDLGQAGVAGILAPMLQFEKDYCREDCHQCGQVCPSGAIARLTLAEKRQRSIGPAIVQREACLRYQGQGCRICQERCPYQAIAMRLSPDGFREFPAVDLANCTGCGACEVYCPNRSKGAIGVHAGEPTALRPSPPREQRQRPGVAIILRDLCLRFQRRECRVCQDRCPYEAITMETSADGFDEYPKVEASKCPGCAVCEAFCPAVPKAIRMAVSEASAPRMSANV